MAKKKGKAGRPSKHTPEVVARIVQAIATGNTRRHSCAYGGISEDAFSAWLKTKPDFAAAIKKAEADAVVRNVAIIEQAARITWQAAAWWLERRYPDDYAKRERLEHSSPGGGPVTFTLKIGDG